MKWMLIQLALTDFGCYCYFLVLSERIVICVVSSVAFDIL